MGCQAKARAVWRRAARQKQVGETDTRTSLRRCLSTLQMTSIGLGATIGVGIYVLLGVAVRDYAGPGVLLSFMLAAVVVLTNAMVFAEFGSYIPHTGAAYTYMYCAVGELAAFITGWMSLFSYTCSAATGARAWSGFVDSLFNNSIQNFLDSKIGQLDLGSPFARSLDWLALTFFLTLTVVVSCNVQCGSAINAILVVLTIAVLVFVSVAGPIIGDVSNMADPATGGFLPYGLGGVVTGASAAFYAFNGFDNICLAAEEAKDPVRSVPRAILLELAIVTVVYCGAAVGTVSLIPYSEIDLRAPIPSAFAYQGVTWARYVVTIGPVLAMTNLSLLSLYAQSRICYRMARDGLLLRQFGYIHPTTKVPLVGVVVSGVLIGVIALLLELKDLVRFSVLCMLAQYILLAPALLALRASLAHPHTHTPTGPTHTPTAHTHRGRDTLAGDAEDARRETTPDSSLLHQRRDNHANENSGVDSLFQQHLSPARRQPPTYSYVTDGDLGFGSRPEPNDGGSSFLQGAGGNSVNCDRLVDVSCQLSPLEDGTAAGSHVIHRHSELEVGSSELADESHQSDEATHPSMASARVPCAANGGWFEGVVGQFFSLLTTRLCLALLVVAMAGLALQLGLAWEDLRRARLAAVVSTSLLLVVAGFLCEVLRKRCPPGSQGGFKVPLASYVAAVSCFLNLVLLVTAADYTGIAEFTVLILLGLLVYVAMVTLQGSRDDEVISGGRRGEGGEESHTLLSHEDNDADSEGSL